MLRSALAPIALTIVLVGPPAIGGMANPSVELALNPQRTYLRTTDDPSLDALIVDLDAVFGLDPILPDGRLGLTHLGDFAFFNEVLEEEGEVIWAVFSGSDTLLPNGNLLNRVPDALDAGLDILTDDIGGLPTDIPEDFSVSKRTVVTVPAGATHLFVSAGDSFFSDNNDLNGDFRLMIEIVPESEKLPGDANNDGLVTGADLISVQQNFGKVGPSPLPGDANNDQSVTGLDLIEVQQNFGKTATVAVIPEPVALLPVLGLLGMIRPRGPRP